MVGVDGSGHADAALLWAAHEAARRGARLEVVHAAFLRHEAVELFAPRLADEEESLLERDVARARRAEPGLEVKGRLEEPPAADALIRAGQGAEMLVVGSRGLGALQSLTLGSVSLECVTRAHCPVVVIQAEVRPVQAD